jgi:hypothetical protein
MAFFLDFLVLQGYLIGHNIIFKCDNDSSMLQNPFLMRIPY